MLKHFSHVTLLARLGQGTWLSVGHDDLPVILLWEKPRHLQRCSAIFEEIIYLLKDIFRSRDPLIGLTSSILTHII